MKPFDLVSAAQSAFQHTLATGEYFIGGRAPNHSIRICKAGFGDLVHQLGTVLCDGIDSPPLSGSISSHFNDPHAIDDLTSVILYPSAKTPPVDVTTFLRDVLKHFAEVPNSEIDALSAALQPL